MKRASYVVTSVERPPLSFLGSILFAQLLIFAGIPIIGACCVERQPADACPRPCCAQAAVAE